MPHILMIATGGTIACCETAHGLSPALDSAALLGALPELSALCTVETLDLMQLDSTDVTAADRQRMAQAVWQNREKFYGFVLTHGTDTLAYTAALLTHLLPHFDKPLVLTGSMLPMGVPDSDAPRNLLDAFRTAADGRAGVYAVMNGQILHGSHVFKQHSTEIDAFLSANAAPAGEICDGEVRWSKPASAPSGAPQLIEQIDTHILPVRLTPDLDPSFFSALPQGRTRSLRRRRRTRPFGSRRARSDPKRHARVYHHAVPGRRRTPAQIRGWTPCRSTRCDFSRQPYLRGRARRTHVR